MIVTTSVRLSFHPICTVNEGMNVPHSLTLSFFLSLFLSLSLLQARKCLSHVTRVDAIAIAKVNAPVKVCGVDLVFRWQW